ncbi:MAG: RNA-directed DNA polymerase [Actinomycetota bacterium]
MQERTAPLARVLALRDPGRRDLVVLHPALAGRYAALVAAVAGRVEAALSPAVVANRVAAHSVAPPSIRLRPWRAERSWFSRRLATLADAAPSLVVTDVVDCYATIAPGVVEASLSRLGCGSAASAAVSSFLRGLARHGVRGLPVGPHASAVLANAVLARVDRALDAAGVAHVRWVDDIVAGVEDAGHARRVIAIIDEALTALGLRRHPGKTGLLDATEVHTWGGVSLARAEGRVG